jgi:predicted phage-related endonuclease
MKKLTIAQEVAMFVERETIIREEVANKERRAEIEAYFKEKCKDKEHITVGGHDVFYKYINAAGTIDENELRAFHPKEYMACAVTKIDAKKLKDEFWDIYKKVCKSGEQQRRFSIKLNMEKLQKMFTKQNTKKCRDALRQAQRPVIELAEICVLTTEGGKK